MLKSPAAAGDCVSEPDDSSCNESDVPVSDAGRLSSQWIKHPTPQRGREDLGGHKMFPSYQSFRETEERKKQNVHQCFSVTHLVMIYRPLVA